MEPSVNAGEEDDAGRANNAQACSSGLPQGIEDKASGGWTHGSTMVNDNTMSSTLLAEFAEIEIRLRQHVLELLEPSIRKQKIVDGAMKDMKHSIEHMQEEIHDLKHAQEDAEAVRTQLDTFRAELAEHNRESKELHQTVGDRLSLQELELTSIRSSIELRQSNATGIERTLQKMADQLVTAVAETSQLRNYCTERVDLCRDKIAKLRDEVETRNLSFEEGLHRLRDHQMDGDTSIRAMTSQIQRINQEVSVNVHTVEDLQVSKASVIGVEQQQKEFQEFARNLNEQVSILKSQFGSLVSDVKAHFETAAHVVGTSTAKQMDDMRIKYLDDTCKVHLAIQTIEKFVSEQQQRQGCVSSDVSQAVEDSSRQYEALREEFESKARKREADCKHLHLEIERLQRSVRDLEDFIKTGFSTGSSKSGIVSLLLEAHLMSACLDAQDDIDRKSIALFGYKRPGASGPDTSRVSVLPNIDGGATKATPRRTLAKGHPTYGGLPDSGLWSDGNHGACDVPPPPTITLDKRCLSCSASAATVLAGFKIACLEYAPGAVEYKKVMYSRTELIRLRTDLLKQACEQIREVD